MSDDTTSKINGDNHTPGMSTHDYVRQLSNRANDLIELLRSQREILQARGMNLPPASLDGLRTLKTRLDSLQRQLAGSQVELRQLRALADNYALINSSLDTDTVLNQVMDTVIAITGAERGYIVLKNKETGEFDQFKVARGLDRSQLITDDAPNRKGEFVISKSIVRDVAKTGEPVLTENASHDSRYQGQNSVVGLSLRSILAVPLKVRGEVIGVVYCDNRIISGLFSQQELDLMKAFSNQAAVAIENAQLFVSAREQLSQVTELRDRMNNIFDSITSGLLALDTTGTITTCNQAAARIIGLEAPVGHTLADLLPQLGEAFFEVLTRVLASGVQENIELEPVITGRGKRYWRVMVNPLRNAVGQGQGLTLVLEDLTAQKQAEAILSKAVGFVTPELLLRADELTLSGQEREITAMFADIRGFTAFSSQYKDRPMELMEIINKYLSVASDGVNLFEGIVDKYLGDAVTGLYNTQLNPQSDHAVRAVNAAMNIMLDQEALHDIVPITPIDQRLAYGIGVHTASAFLGNVGSADRKEFAALGEAMTICKIMQEHAEKIIDRDSSGNIVRVRGEVIISEATYEAVKHVFECEPRPADPDKLKDHTEIKTIYKVLRRRKGTGTGSLFLDDELAELLKGIGSEN
ncbi:MAG: GAF domain-containing protein [bacterium]|nr:GAF domain-containing protein [bacterium]